MKQPSRMNRFNSKAPWVMSSVWAVSRDPYNWILMRPKGNGWRSVSYHGTPEQLLQSLYRKILRTEPPQTDLVRHLETCLGVAQACSERLAVHIHTSIGAAAKITPQTAHTTLDQQHG